MGVACSGGAGGVYCVEGGPQPQVYVTQIAV